MDVHPPLAKLLITLFGWLAGFDGNFDFKEIGKDYLEPGVPYVAMRLFPAICGILLAPTMFLTLKAAGCRTFTAALGAGFIIFGMWCPLRIIPTTSTTTNRVCREWPPDAGAADPPRLSPDDRHCLYRICLHLLHQPARARPLQGLLAHLVVLAHHDRPRSGSDCQHQVGWSVYHCLGWSLDPGPALGSAWRLQERVCGRHPQSPTATSPR